MQTSTCTQEHTDMAQALEALVRLIDYIHDEYQPTSPQVQAILESDELCAARRELDRAEQLGIPRGRAFWWPSAIERRLEDLRVQKRPYSNPLTKRAAQSA